MMLPDNSRILVEFLAAERYLLLLFIIIDSYADLPGARPDLPAVSLGRGGGPRTERYLKQNY